MHRSKSEYAIQTVDNAVRLIEAFESDEELGVTELARRLHLHKNNVFRLLATLEQRGYVEETPDDRYRLGSACLRMGQSYLRSNSLLTRTRSILEALTGAIRETTHLAVLRGFAVVHLDGEQAEGPLQATKRLGERLPCHCTALGKVLVGCDRAETLESFDREMIVPGKLEASTERTLVARDPLVEHLGKVRSQGWALDLEEYALGLHCAAAPIFDAEGRAVGAISASGPALRLGRERLEHEVVPELQRAAGTVSESLGYTL